MGAVATADLPVVGLLMSPNMSKENANGKSALEGHTSTVLEMRHHTKGLVLSAVVSPTVQISTRHIRAPTPLALVHTGVPKINIHLHLQMFDHPTLLMEWLDRQVILRQTFLR